MKVFLFVAASLAFATATNAQHAKSREQYKGLPVMRSSVDTISFSVANEGSNRWLLSPDTPADTLGLFSVVPLAVSFQSDADSIRYIVGPGQSHHFYVKCKGRYAHTVIYNRATISVTRYQESCKADSLRFVFNKEVSSVKYYQTMRSLYPLDSCARLGKTDAERVLHVMHWVHRQWKHNGNQSPQKNDALSILDEVRTSGKGFPCFAYAEVLRASLNALGIPTRRLALKTKNVETEQYASGHVANEVYLRDLKKWVFVDPQEDVMPYYKGVPLNAAEFQQAITRYKDQVELRSLSVINKLDYINFAYPYLFYMDAAFDQRYDVPTKQIVAGKTNLMLVPLGARNPGKAGFYNNQVIDYCFYSNCRKAFYQAPAYQ